MPIIDGQRWACELCIKGHRVRGCNHYDRELKHIAPKGRPQKQCEHCRLARKSNSHHVKCDCGEKIQNARSDVSYDVFGHVNNDIAFAAAEMVEHDCCCIHGGKCICGMKRGSGSLNSKSARRSDKSRPKSTTAPSENTPIVVADGHHNPCNRPNNAAYVSGAPYEIPRPHTLDCATAAQATRADLAQSYTDSTGVLQRPVDGSILYKNSSNVPDGMAGLAQRSIDRSPLTTQPDKAGTDPFGVNYADFHYGILPAAPVTTSGFVSSTGTELSEAVTAEQWPSFSAIMPTSLYRADDYSTSPLTEFFTNTDNGWGALSVGLNPSWSAEDLVLDPDTGSGSFVQPLSHSDNSIADIRKEFERTYPGKQRDLGR